MLVHLTTGYDVEIHEPDGLQHLYQAIFGEVLERLGPGTERGQFWEQVHIVCICELHYVAGQLHHQKSALTINDLLTHFQSFWNDVGERIHKDAD
ncbi:MAG: hypothetical protein IPK26_22195 [Planctomycetes bacterium]|nr:hypothetical protein [Planctomycetota bacterium]